MSSFRLAMCAAVLLLLACGSEPRAPKPPGFTEAFSHLPLPPDPELVSRQGSEDALQITVRSPADVGRVTDYYRKTLSQGSWRLVSDLTNADGSTALYAEHDGPPLWVRIWKPTDQAGTMVQLTGAVTVPDSLRRQHERDSATKRRASQQS